MQKSPATIEEETPEPGSNLAQQLASLQLEQDNPWAISFFSAPRFHTKCEQLQLRPTTTESDSISHQHMCLCAATLKLLEALWASGTTSRGTLQTFTCSTRSTGPSGATSSQVNVLTYPSAILRPNLPSPYTLLNRAMHDGIGTIVCLLFMPFQLGWARSIGAVLLTQRASSLLCPLFRQLASRPHCCISASDISLAKTCLLLARQTNNEHELQQACGLLLISLICLLLQSSKGIIGGLVG